MYKSICILSQNGQNPVDEGLDAFDTLVKATSRDKSVVSEASDEKKVLEIDTIVDDKQDIIEY